MSSYIAGEMSAIFVPLPVGTRKKRWKFSTPNLFCESHDVVDLGVVCWVRVVLTWTRMSFSRRNLIASMALFQEPWTPRNSSCCAGRLLSMLMLDGFYARFSEFACGLCVY